MKCEEIGQLGRPAGLIPRPPVMRAKVILGERAKKIY